MKTNKKLSLKKIIPPLLLIALIAGNFAVSSTPAFAAMPQPVLASVRIGACSYFDLREYASRHGYSFSWDPLLKIASVRGRTGEARFQVGCTYYLKKNVVECLGAKVRFYQGTVMAPLEVQSVLGGLSEGERIGSPILVSAPVTASAEPAVSGKLFKVVLDPGHGGRDHGAISSGGIHEKKLVLDISKKIRDRMVA